MSNRRKFFKDFSASSAGLLLSSSSLASNLTTISYDTLEEKVGAIANNILAYIRIGDQKELSKLFKNNPLLKNLKDERDRSLLWYASLYKQTQLYELLKENYTLDIWDYVSMGDATRLTEIATSQPVLLNIRNKYGYTPLLAACECGEGLSVETLVAFGAQLDAFLPDDIGDTPLTLALQNTDKERVDWMVQILLGNNANPNKKTIQGRSPLHIAVRNNHVFAVKMLLRKGANIETTDEKGDTSLKIAKEKGLVELTSILEQPVSIEKDLYLTRYTLKSNTKGITEEGHGLPQLLINDFVTVAHFNLEKTEAYLKRIPSLLLMKASWDEMAIEGCAHLGNEKVTTYLVEKGAPYSICTATMLGDMQKVKQYLSEDKRVLNDRGPHDFPLIWYTAIGKPKLEIAELLLDKGTEINEHIRGRTILSECANRGHAELMDFLLSRGADATIKSLSSFMRGTPFEIATRRKHEKVLLVLKKYRIYN